MWRAAGALLGLVAAIDHESGLIPVPRTGLWAPRTAPTVLPLRGNQGSAHRPSLWSTKYEPPFQAQQFNPAAARVLEQKEFRVPPALKKPLLAAAKLGAHTKQPVQKLKPTGTPVPSVLWQPTPKPNSLPPLSLAKEFDTPYQFGDVLSSRYEQEERQEADEDASEEALAASDPILAKLDNIAAALHAMRHPEEPRMGGPQLGVAQLRQHVHKAPLRAGPPGPVVQKAQAPRAAPAPPMPHHAAGAWPTPPSHAASPAVAAPRPELSALRKQSSDDGLNRLFGDDAGMPTAPPLAKKKVLALARVVGSVRQTSAVAAPEALPSLASVYARPHRT